MAIIERSRVIRPSSRKASSSYKVDVSKVGIEDELHLVITHESNDSYRREFTIPGTKLANRDSIHFKWTGSDVELNY